MLSEIWARGQPRHKAHQTPSICAEAGHDMLLVLLVDGLLTFMIPHQRHHRFHSKEDSRDVPRNKLRHAEGHGRVRKATNTTNPPQAKTFQELAGTVCLFAMLLLMYLVGFRAPCTRSTGPIRAASASLHPPSPTMQASPRHYRTLFADMFARLANANGGTSGERERQVGRQAGGMSGMPGMWRGSISAL